MSRYSSDISNMSYTNKDFGSIYPELLELAQKLSYKWDPVTSDESDPGVVLLKLAAVVADKNNYNIDKNILETFPTSVTQLDTARQLFNQLGYTMRHYYSAETTVSIAINEEPELDHVALGVTEDDVKNATWVKENKRSYDFPRFTMVSDIYDEIVYTLIEPITISSDKRLRDVPAIQGIIQDYTVNNDKLIHATAIDYNNRLYFSDSNIAENGIFISNAGSEDWSRWYLVDNLSIQPLGTHCYKFGVSVGDGRCYIEFPSDYENLIGNGLHIKYVTSSGKLGNIGKNRLKKFFTDTTAYVYLTDNGSIHTSDNAIQIESSNVTILNYNSATSGRDPETIDEAYDNYEKVKTTFDTLVSLKDYTNYLTRQDFKRPYSSNGFVCDRTNDVQTSYKVVNEFGESSVHMETELSPVVDACNLNGEPISGVYRPTPLMSAFDLRIYALHYSSDITTTDGFKKSFEVQLRDSNDVYGVAGYKDSIQKIKCIQHDYKDFEIGKIILLKNKFPIVAKIIPQYKVDSGQMIDMLNNIRTALFDHLNASKVKFGEAPDYNELYDAILGSDNRIKALILDELEYETYALYTINNIDAIEIRIDDDSTQPPLVVGNKYEVDGVDYQPHIMWKKFREEIFVKSVLAGVTPLFPDKNQFLYAVNQNAHAVYDNIHKIDSEVRLGMSGSRTEVEDSEPVYNSSIKLAKNENILFTMPSLIKDKDYGSYVKFLVHIQSNSWNDIEKDSEFELRDNDFIVFLWKTSDSDDFYTYRKYTKDSEARFLCPSFRLFAKNPELSSVKELPSIETLFNKFKSVPEGDGVTSYMGNISYEVKGEPKSINVSEFVRQLSGDNYVLSGDKMITPKKPNTVHINNDKNGTELVSWYLNSSKEGYKTVLFDVGESSYTLQDGESFIYWNKSKSHIVSLGAGTVIERDRTDKKWECSYFDYAEFVNNPVDYLDEIVFTIPIGTNVYAKEMMFYQIGPGNTVSFEWIGDDHIKIGGNNANTAPSNRIYIDKDGTFGEFVDGGGNINRYTFSLSGVNITYTDEDGNTTTLPKRNSVSANWEAVTLYNMDCSPSVEQEILNINTGGLVDQTHEQKIFFKTDSNQPAMNINKCTDIKIRSSAVTTVVGGSNVDVSYWNILTGKTKPISVYLYEDTVLPDVASLDESGQKVIITIPEVSNSSTVISKSINYKVPAGDYILSMSQTGGAATVSLLGYGALTSIRETLSGNKTSYYLYHSTGDSSELKLQCEPSTSSPLKIVINPLFRTVIRSNSDSQNYLPAGMTINDIYSGIDALDYAYDFDYAYLVPTDVRIDNPISSYAFIDANHPYNRAVICEWDAENEDTNRIDITNKIK